MNPAPGTNKSRRPTLSASPPTVPTGFAAAFGLTPRECEVMKWICEGKRDREIAIILGLSARTIQVHVGHIFEKLNVETRTAAANHCFFSIVRPAASRKKKKRARGGRPNRL